MRVLTGSLIQESNTFSPLKSDLAFFHAGCLLFDAESLTAMAGKQTELGGFIEAARRGGVELVPTLAAWAASGGPFDARDFATLSEMLLSRVRDAGSVDGVLLALHGAWVSEDHNDPDGWLLEQIRRIVGPNVPIVATLDLHANITARMTTAADALVGFRSYPHLDMLETGIRAADLLFDVIRRHIRPSIHYCKVPMLVPPENSQTTDGPLADLMADTVALESLPHYLSASLFVVQPWLDVAELGCAALVVTEGESELGALQANRLGERLWRRREEFAVPLATPSAAVARALTTAEGPIILVDSADGVSSGASGDSTAILHALVEARAPRQSLVTVVDPRAAAIASQNDGKTITLHIGGTFDPERHAPIVVTGTAHRVPDGRVTFSGGVGDGLSADMGNAAVFDVGNVRILLMENPVPCYDPALYRAAGLEPGAAHIVVVKSPNNFRWTYRELARSWIYVDAPGASTPRLATLRYTRAPRPIFPLDSMAWQAPRG